MPKPAGSAVRRRGRAAASPQSTETKGGQAAAAARRSGTTPWRLVLIAVAVVSVAVAGLLYEQHRDRTPRCLKPLPAPLLKDLPEFGGRQRDELFWGTYRAGLYTGMRTREAAGLQLGLAWWDASADPASQAQSIRHDANHGDRLRSFSWVAHDGRRYGEHRTIDGRYNITTYMVKEFPAGSGFGGDWAVRFEVDFTDDEKARRAAQEAESEQRGAKEAAPRRNVGTMIYIVDEAHRAVNTTGRHLTKGARGAGGYADYLLAVGGSPEAATGEWELRASGTAGGRKAWQRATWAALKANDVTFAYEVLQASLSGAVQPMIQPSDPKIRGPRLPNQRIESEDRAAPHINVAAWHVSVAVPGSVDILFLSNATGSARPDEESVAAMAWRGHDGKRPVPLTDRVVALSRAELTKRCQAERGEFERRIRETFPAGLPVPGVSDQVVERATQAAVANLVGSIGYFYGSSFVQIPPAEVAAVGWNRGKKRGDVFYARSDDAPLYTGVPSRSFFPRGFLWDEGFHLLLLSRWDPGLAREVLAHWLDLMNVDGWIAREQILGEEAIRRVPQEFLAQHPDNANPPSFFLTFQLLLRGASGGLSSPAWTAEQQATTRTFLAAAYPRVRAWFEWLRRSQGGSVKGSFRWRGRNPNARRELNPKTLASGLDDYPRASHPGPEERHLDLLCWMAVGAKVLSEMAGLAGDARGARRYAGFASAWGDMRHLRKLHAGGAEGEFYDYGRHTEDVALSFQPVINSAQGGAMQMELLRAEGTPPREGFVPQYGFVSMFPLALRLIPPGDSAELSRQLTLLADWRRCWTEHGLRSLGKSASLYDQRNTEHDAPYWRGPIWININYLVWSALEYYSEHPDVEAGVRTVAADLARRLRAGLVRTVAGGFEISGYIWEHYRDDTAQGLGTHPFTGWSALVALIAGGGD
ncbi:unnamed protein product [Pedinophyceae sp. YPF-701]|nr:unnamed protein product [Pedinophyceae sp. YPF-701]